MIEGQRGCVTCLSWAHTQQGCTLKDPKSPGSGAVSLRCQESEGKEVCGRAHHRMLHGRNSTYTAADSGWGAPRGAGASGPDLFAGRPVGSILTAGATGAIFEIVEAPVLSEEGRWVPGIVFMDSGSKMNFIAHKLAQQLELEGAHAKICPKVVDNDFTKKVQG